MGRKPLSPEQRDAMRAKILEAARKQFLKGGLNNLSMRDIAANVGISAMTIYLYFKNRQAIVFALIREGLDKLRAEMYRFADVRDPMDRLVRMGEAYVGFAFENPQYYRALTETIPHNGRDRDRRSEHAKLLDEVSAMVKPILNTVGELTGSRKTKEATNETLVLWCVLHGFVSLALNDRLRFLRASDDDLREELRRMVPRMLTVRRAAS